MYVLDFISVLSELEKEFSYPEKILCLEQDKICPDTLRTFMRLINAKTPEEIEDIPLETVLDMLQLISEYEKFFSTSSPFQDGKVYNRLLHTRSKSIRRIL